VRLTYCALCDIQNSVGEMLCAGILPINQMRDYVSPATVMSSRIPQQLLEATYGMHIVRELDFKDNPDRPPNGHEMLIAYCAVKGYITSGTGRWDEFRACKEMLRDFNDGRILFVAPPFAEDPENPESVEAVVHWRRETEKIMTRSARTAERLTQYAAAGDAAVTRMTTSHAYATVSGYAPGSMVFGEGDWNGDEGEDNEFGNEQDDGGDEETEQVGEEGGEGTKREHKKLKHWGKKNKKLRDKNPYGEHSGPSSYAVYSTNRARTGVTKSEEELNKRRQDPRVTYGAEFTRPQHPHQMGNTPTLTGKLEKKIGNPLNVGSSAV
jgi:large subunit GTPase 1